MLCITHKNTLSSSHTQQAEPLATVGSVLSPQRSNRMLVSLCSCLLPQCWFIFTPQPPKQSHGLCLLTNAKLVTDKKKYGKSKLPVGQADSCLNTWNYSYRNHSMANSARVFCIILNTDVTFRIFILSANIHSCNLTVGKLKL